MVLRRMLAQRRVPGALLFAGEDGVGKKLFAVELAKALNCRARVSGEACDQCTGCLHATRFEFPDPEDTEANKHIIWSGHQDVGLIHAAGRFITVGQIRELDREVNFRPSEGAARVFIVEDADKLNEASSNALLKTLEEPPSTSHVILLTSRPASLLPTIRSRCQTVRFALLTAKEIEDYLVQNRRRSGHEARLAAHLARGRLGPGLELNLEEYCAERQVMLGILEALTINFDRARLLRVAEELADAKHKDEYEPHLEVLETLMHDLWLLSLNETKAELVNEDIREILTRLGKAVSSRRVAAWLERIEDLRRQLAVNINRRAATDALFLAMAAEH